MHIFVAKDGRTCFVFRMGNWGFLPLENDAASDWNERLFQETDIESHVMSALELNVHEEPETVRAAAQLVAVLSGSGIWLSETRKQVLELAAFKLSQILDDKVLTNVGFVAEIRKEIRVLHSLTRGPSQGGAEL